MWPDALAQAVVAAAPDGIVVVDAQGRIIEVNAALLALSGHPREALLGQTLDVLLPPAQRAKHRQLVQRFWAQPHARPMGQVPNLFLQRADGTTVAVDIAIGVAQCAAGPCVVAYVRDASATRRLLHELAHQAAHDPLTGLANRAALLSQLRQAIAAAQRHGHTAALLLLDLDQFKEINDTHGHPMGDRVLQCVAERLRAAVRTDDAVARLGGDEFALLLPRVESPSDALRVGDKVLQALMQPLALDSQRFSLSASIGVACCPQHGQQADELLRHADLALYAAKEAGRQQVAAFAPALSAAMQERAQLHTRLQQALRHGGLALHYQPQVDLRSGAVVAVEALLRWTDPEWGPIPPARFIPVAEATGLILPLGDWVLHEAVQQLRRWLDRGLRWRVAVNVAPQQFRQPGWVAQLRALLQRYAVPPSLLELEITESQLMLDPESARQTLHALAALGVRVALDDFGTGHSSFARLKELPVQRLKIDRSFLQRIPDDATDAALVRGVLALARTLRLEVVAEGVESEVQRAFLRRHRCPLYQGWLCAPALPAAELLSRFAPANAAVASERQSA